MTTFWIFIAIVVLISLALIWVPHFRQKKLLEAGETEVRKKTNLELFNERLTSLEKEHSEGILDDQEFESLKKELEISLLQDMKQAKDETLAVSNKPRGLLWPSLMSVAVLALAGYAYYHLGAYQEVEATAADPANPHAGMTPEQLMAKRVNMLETAVAKEPDNSQAWFSLGHAYISAGEFDKAVQAFDKVMDLVGVHAELLGPKATALYYKAGQRMIPIVQSLIDQALKMDPKDPSTLLLVGMNAFYTADYQKAIDSWQTILDSDRNDVDRAALIDAVNTAKMRLQGNTGPMPDDATHNKLKQGEASAADATQQPTAGTVTVKVSVAPALAGKISDTDTVFIFARPTEGPSVPVAATKVSAKALPVTVTLDDSTSMGSSVKLSTTKAVEIIAVLSKHGNVKPEPGDLKGSVASVDVGGEGNLVLDTEVK
ncbi:c-type cytochrome biogenesis protein CcmI [Shewanella yunxiaonensis]|uniref:C-type cytochrome biogenesis protein CcmI n=1 Tax=Shewanella yunxiaonensis TaxID=2829809 RepID=A0ABX7YTN4_9GAMM|nr:MULTISPECIES: c-type cytochrome biogenesis protein CcmI [Shewanella]MDF0536022.1 c-type cytochrome biogenesis protein CcmI [Shewanella sp. A32]QUN05689.1 c-type cytochrome biogenesis protein CcmI [Shewanella yunxiaonensis]